MTLSFLAVNFSSLGVDGAVTRKQQIQLTKTEHQIEKTKNEKKKTDTRVLKGLFFYSLCSSLCLFFFFHRQKIPTEYEFPTRNEKKPWADLTFAKTFGIVTGDVLVSYWPIFSLSSVTVSEVFAKVNSAPVSL